MSNLDKNQPPGRTDRNGQKDHSARLGVRRFSSILSMIYEFWRVAFCVRICLALIYAEFLTHSSKPTSACSGAKQCEYVTVPSKPPRTLTCCRFSSRQKFLGLDYFDLIDIWAFPSTLIRKHNFLNAGVTICSYNDQTRLFLHDF